MTLEKMITETVYQKVKKELPEKVLDMLVTQKFADWYTNGNFGLWCAGGAGEARQKMIKDIESMLF
jgi:hypothetical protein